MVNFVVFFYTVLSLNFWGKELMRKLLVGLFLVFILGFGILGYTQANDDSGEIVNENNYSMNINS